MFTCIESGIETDRLLIRAPRPGDGKILYDAVVESIDELRPWLTWASDLQSIERSEATCRRAYAKYLLNEECMVFFFMKSSGVLAGAGGLHNINWSLKQFEVGYWARTSYVGKGLITEATKALCCHARNRMRANRVYLTTDSRNTRSRLTAERSGFALEGTLQNERLGVDGSFRDTCVYSFYSPKEIS
jgi:RimJ/RimL family protein N-acetyltransferase